MIAGFHALSDTVTDPPSSEVTPAKDPNGVAIAVLDAFLVVSGAVYACAGQPTSNDTSVQT